MYIYFFINAFGAIGSSISPLGEQRLTDVVAIENPKLKIIVAINFFSVLEILIISIPPIECLIYNWIDS